MERRVEKRSGKKGREIEHKRRNEKRSKTQKTTCNKEKEERKDEEIRLPPNNV